jgi:hypothetical protein
MDQQKVALVEALSRRGSALCRIYIIGNARHSKGEDTDAQEQPAATASAVSRNSIDKAWRDVLRFTDTNDTKVCGSFFFFCLNLILSGYVKNISIYSFRNHWIFL